MTNVVLQALHMEVWRRKPEQRVLIHSDQGSQFTSMEWAAFIRARIGNERVAVDRAVVIARAELRDRLTNPRIRRRLDDDPAMATCVETLTAMAALKPDEGEHLLAWI